MFLNNDQLLRVIIVVISFVAGQWFTRGREKKRFERQKLSNLYNLFFQEYLSEKVKKARKNVELKINEEEKPSSKLTAQMDILARALQRVSVLSFTGAIPVKFVITLNGTQIVGDWVILKDHLRGKDADLDKIPALWRHAEWLALIAWLRFEHTELQMTEKDKKSMKQLLSEYNENPDSILKREKRLRLFDKDFIDDSSKNLANTIRQNYSKRIKPLSKLEEIAVKRINRTYALTKNNCYGVSAAGDGHR